MSVDWDKIRVEYIRSDISQRELAAKHNISHKTIECRSTKESWTAQRLEYQGKVRDKIGQKLETTADKEAEEIIKLRADVKADFIKIKEACLEPENFDPANAIRANIELGKIVEVYPAAKSELKISSQDTAIEDLA